MRNHLVVTPGYYGSKLEETTSGNLVWLDGRGLLDPELTTDPADALFRSAQPGQSPFGDPSWCETEPMRSLLSAAGTKVSGLLPGTLPVDSCLIYGTRRRTTASCQAAALPLPPRRPHGPR